MLVMNKSRVVKTERSKVALRLDRVSRVKSRHPPSLVVEIHNEGVFCRVNCTGAIYKNQAVNADKEKDAMRANKDKLMPWGRRARQFLYDVLCGVIPDDEAVLRLKNNPSRNKCGVDTMKCLLLDLRTSDTTASADRSAMRKKITNKMVEESVKRQRDEIERLKVAAQQSANIHTEAARQDKKTSDIVKQLSNSLKKLKADLTQVEEWHNPAVPITDEMTKNLIALKQNIHRMSEEIQKQSVYSTMLKERVVATKQRSRADNKLVSKAEAQLKKSRKASENQLLNGPTGKVSCLAWDGGRGFIRQGHTRP